MTQMGKPVTMLANGRVTLPKTIRDRRNWTAGTRLVVVERDDGVLLRPAPLFPPARIEDVFGSLAGPGTALTVERMDGVVLPEARRRDRD